MAPRCSTSVSNLLLVPPDRRGQWYRYHHLFRDMLRAELERVEPGLVPELRRRAAGWRQRNDLPEDALEYSMAAGDVEAAALLIDGLRVPTYNQTRIATLQRRLRWLDARYGLPGSYGPEEPRVRKFMPMKFLMPMA